MYTLLLDQQKTALDWLLDQHTKLQGSILADEMGLGKTITTIALLYCLHLTLKKKGLPVGATLIICPATLINQWSDEMETWSLPTLHAPEVFLLSKCTTQKEKRALLKKVVAQEGVLIVSYD